MTSVNNAQFSKKTKPEFNISVQIYATLGLQKLLVLQSSFKLIWYCHKGRPEGGLSL